MTSTTYIVSVLIPVYLEALDYLYDPRHPLQPGDYVIVPFGSQERIGVIWCYQQETKVLYERLKWIKRRLHVPSMPEISRRFIDWVAWYILEPRGQVLRLAIGNNHPQTMEENASYAFIQPWTTVRLGRNTADATKRSTKSSQRLFHLLREQHSDTITSLTKKTKCSLKVIQEYIHKGILEIQNTYPDPVPIILSPIQQQVAYDLCTAVRKQMYQVLLVDGVTGSGKTEVYCKAIEACVLLGRQVLLLLPEIALTSAMMERLRRHFSIPPTLWHSKMHSIYRENAWGSIANGTSKIVVGARSALFLPYLDLGLIIVDEEHDGSFKQEEGIRYHARDMAVVRAFLAGIPIVLVSATPSIESHVNLKLRGYRNLCLPYRYHKVRLPQIRLVDLRKEKREPYSLLSPELQRAMAKNLELGQQTLLFLNRLGYAPLTLCRSCGHRIQCKNCSTNLTYHHHINCLLCHYCGYKRSFPERCDKCQQSTLLVYGAGVERVEQAVESLFPQSRRLILTSETLKKSHIRTSYFEKIQHGEVDIMIGTQILAKGYHFPLLTVVGVVDGDFALHGGDFRTAERTYQMLHQVAGRAGRETQLGDVFIQTFEPEHLIMQTLAQGDRKHFLSCEIEARRYFNLPPFTRFIALIISGPQHQSVEEACLNLSRTAPQSEKVTIFGPAEAPLAKLRGRHRKRFLIQGPKNKNLQGMIKKWLQQTSLPKAVRVDIDVDPYHFV